MTYSAEIPYGCYWSTPFAKWQGSFSNLNSIEFAAHVAGAELAKRGIDPASFDYGVLGTSVPQKHAFYGLPWLTGMIGAGHVGGPTVAQACATGVRCLLTAAQEIESGLASSSLVITADRTSNGPHLYYPNPRGPGGTGASEDWVMDNFGCDPLGRHSMLQTAENVATKHGIATETQHEIVLRRTEQYGDAVADDHAFQKKYMTLPFDVPNPRYRKNVSTLDGDEGVTLSTAEGIADLKPVMPEGSVTFAGQTYPADGNTGLIVTTAQKARELSRDANIRISILGFGLSRTDLAYMPEAPVPAAKAALKQAGVEIDAIDAIKTHNPFAINDILFARETGVDVMNMNNFGCSLIWGHPQGPTGLRSIIELIEELAAKGGGLGLFTGCAAGDTAMATVIKIGD
jgi:acetyl-CoA acetyltransferase